jgi:hypothetical protein
MSWAQTERTRKKWREVRRWGIYGICLALACLWEVHDQIELSKPPCDAPTAEPEPLFHDFVYTSFLNLVPGVHQDRVRQVAITSNLADIQQNVCLGRSYMADLLKSLRSQGAAVIVLDKFFGDDLCNGSHGAATLELKEAVQSLGVPVVVGESTDLLPKERFDSCLVRKPQLEFESANVRRGGLRFNTDKTKLPLQWLVLPAGSGDTRPVEQPTLAMVAAETAEPSEEAHTLFQSLAHGGAFPYGKMNTHLPQVTSSDLLCVAGTAAMRERWAPDCTHAPTRLDLGGKVVVVGAEMEVDHPVVLGARHWGFELQALYIDDLLTRQYLRAVPVQPVFLLCLFFLSFLEILIHVAGWVCRKKWGWNELPMAVYGGVMFVWSLVFATGVVVFCLWARYLPPPVVLATILVGFVGRFAVASLEHSDKALID